jgi:hypothetical protein
MEMVYILKKQGEGYVIEHIVPRTEAEEKGLRHLTTICILFGEDKKLIFCERSGRVMAKADRKCPPANVEQRWNALGGHATPTDQCSVGEMISDEIIYASLRKELSEELKMEAGSGEEYTSLEIWENGEIVGYKKAVEFPVPLSAPIKIGMTEHNDPKNMEYSYVFALKISKEQYGKIITADDYSANGKTKHIYMPHACFSKEEIDAPAVKFEDAIMRLYAPENKAVLEKLWQVIEAECS